MTINQNQPQEEPKQKRQLKVLFSVDDVHPEMGYGLYENLDQFKYLKRLHDEFGIKFTLFMVPRWRNNQQLDIRLHKNWITWIKNQGFYEIAMHGLTHTGAKPELGAMELMGIPLEEVQQKIQESKHTFQECGIIPTGFKTPGWAHPKELYQILPMMGINWIADHFMGEQPITMSNGLVQIPYNCNIEHLEFAYPKKIAIFHSHISPQEGNKNGWTEELYNKTREYMLKLKEECDFECLTMTELIEELKNGREEK